MKFLFATRNEKNNMNVICSICQDNARVPVRFTCFPCRSEIGPSCNSISRVCLMCAREYLQLNKKRSERILYRKCITCPVTVQCSKLKAIHSYEKDYFIMSHDQRKDYPCFHDRQGCIFKGTQNELDHHIQTECSFRIISCRLCKSYYQAQEEQQHVYSCPQRFCCFHCEEFIPLYEEKEHYLSHDLKKCIYCHRWIATSLLEQHIIQCPECPRECIYCNKRVQKQQMYNHIAGHLDLFQKIIIQNNNTNNELLSRIPLLLEECKKYV